MDLSAVSTTQWAIVIAVVVVIAAAAIAIWFSGRKRRTEKLRTQFGGTEYTRAVKEGGGQRKAEAALDKRAERVEGLHAPGPYSRPPQTELGRPNQADVRFVDSPGGAVMDADQLLSDVMSTRGYPLSDFEQRAADISVDHPLVLENYRAAHQSALRQTRGQANTEDLRQAMIHYRTLFDELVCEPKTATA